MRAYNSALGLFVYITLNSLCYRNVPHGNVCVQTKHNQTKGELPRMNLDNTKTTWYAPFTPTRAFFFLNHNNQ